MSDNEEIGSGGINEPTPEDNESAVSDAEKTLPETAEADTAPPDNGDQSAAPPTNEEGGQDGKETEQQVKKPVKIPLFAAVVAVLAVAVLTAQITFLSVRQSYHNKLQTVEKGRFADSKMSEVDEIYRKYYINGVDDEKLVDGLIEGYIYGAGDKYGNYMSAAEYRDYLDSLNSKTEGIGASVIWNTDYYAIEIVYVYEGSPAEEAGITIGDLIVEADGKAISELGFDAGVSAIKGEAGTSVKLTVRRGENYTEVLQIEAVRKAITVKTVSLKTYGEIAVISISNFYATTPAELKSVVSEAVTSGCDRIVFDLRNNPGGLLQSVQSVLDYILPEGVTVRMLNAAGEWAELKSDASCIELPMVVMVNGNTASAAELFTSALMDYGYATVIGTQTYGKGTVTEPFQLSDGSVIYVSTEHYYPPKSDNFEGKGITPDEIVELDEESKNINFYKLTYENDKQLQRAIEIIKEK